MSRIDIEAFEDEWEDDAPLPASGPGDRAPTPDDHPVGRVVGLHKGWVDVRLDDEEISAVYGGAMRGEQVVVGDWVRVRPSRRDTDTARVVARLDRDTVLLRTADDALMEERLVVANADQAVVIVTCEALEVEARFIDRVLVAAEAGGLDGAVVVNKSDLLEGNPGLERAVAELESRYRSLGYPVVRTSARTGHGLDDLRALLPGTWTVLAGHSGVGKSSLFNLLVPDADQTIGELGRFGGRHTTASTRAIPVPGLDEAWLIDTPGVRSFGLAMIAPDELAAYFPELADVRCELPGCLHDGEPGCRVPDLVGDSVHPARHESYLRFLRVLRGDT